MIGKQRGLRPSLMSGAARTERLVSNLLSAFFGGGPKFGGLRLNFLRTGTGVSPKDAFVAKWHVCEACLQTKPRLEGRCLLPSQLET